MMQAWKYTLPGFVVPVMFCLSPDGLGILLMSDWQTVLEMTLTSSVALAGFAIAAAGWIAGRANALERAMAAVGSAALMAPHYYWQMAGTGLILAVVAAHLFKRSALS